MADTNQVNSFISTYNTVAFSVLSSAFYCFSLFDSIGDYAYSPTIYANSISISTTTTIPTNTVTSSITSSSTTTKPTTSTTIQYTTTIPSNTIANHTSSTSITTTIQAIPLSNLTISMVSGVTATSTGGSATIRASWFGNARPFRMYVFSGSSTACGSDTRPVTYLSFNASPAYFPVYPNASAYYCYKLMDAAGSLSYSLTQYINVPYICAPPSVYNATTMGCWSPRVAVSVSNSSQAAIQNISSSIGISANALIALSTTPNSVVVNCNGCNGAVNNTQGITTISAAGNIPSRANTLSTNTTLLNQFVTNSTPKGFSIINSTIMSSNQTNGTANGVVISWNSSSAVGSQNISVATIRKITANQSSITPAQLGAQYVLNYMPNVSSISVMARIARLTNTASDFGKELDSLADVITFGMAPSILAFVWGFHFLSDSMNLQLRQHLTQAGAFVCFLFLLSGASRLARFNISPDAQPRNPGRADRKYFVGMPIPAAAGLLAATVHFFNAYPVEEWWVAVPWLILVGLTGFLMVSTWRFWSAKEINFSRRHPFHCWCCWH